MHDSTSIRRRAAHRPLTSAMARGVCAGMLGVLALPLAATPAAAEVESIDPVDEDTPAESVYVVDTFVDTVDAAPGDGICGDVDGACSLRAAVQEANADADVTEIQVPAGVFHLTRTGTGEDEAATGDLDLLERVRIMGAGADATSINGGKRDRIFDAFTAYAIVDLRLTGGRPEPGADGGALRSFGWSGWLVRLEFVGNRARNGGALASPFGLLVGLSAFRNNVATGDGGAVHTQIVLAIGNDFVGNVAGGDGGGMYLHGYGFAYLLDHRLIDNRAGGAGGAVYFQRTGHDTDVGFASEAEFRGNRARVGGAVAVGPGGPFRADNNVYADNTAEVAGGHVFVDGAVFTDLDSTAVNGSAPRGGAIAVAGPDGEAHASSVRFVGNVASAAGGAVDGGVGSTVTLSDAVVERNSAPVGGGLWSSGRVGVGGTRFVQNAASVAGGGAWLAGRSVLAGAQWTGNTAPDGGAVWLSDGADATVRDSTLFRNDAERGGALFVSSGAAVEVEDSFVRENRAQIGGGVFSAGDLTMLRVGLARNRAAVGSTGAGGGAVHADGGSVSLTESNLQGNRAVGAGASGGAVQSVGARVSVIDTRVESNVADRAGGGFEVVGGRLEVSGSTLRKNRTGPGPGNGGGVHVTGSGDVSIVDSLVRVNDAANEGGGVWNAGGTMTLTGVNIGANTSPLGPDAFNNGGAGGTGTLIVNGTNVPAGTGV